MHIRLEVHLVQVHKLGPLEEFPAEVHDQHDGQFNVETDKADAVEFGAEAAPSLDKHEKRVEHDRNPRAERISPVLEREQMRLALAGDGGTEAKRSDADGDPAELVGNTDEAISGAVSDMRTRKRWNKCLEASHTFAASSKVDPRQ